MIGPASRSAVTKCTVTPLTLDAVLERLPLRVKTGKRRQQRRMDVENRVRERVDERRADEPHEAGKTHEPDVARLRSSRTSARS